MHTHARFQNHCLDGLEENFQLYYVHGCADLILGFFLLLIIFFPREQKRSAKKFRKPKFRSATTHRPYCKGPEYLL